MKLPYCSMIGTLSALATAGVLVLGSAAPVRSAEAETDEEVKILTRGPVHEAFAESVSFQPEPGLIVTAVPPAPIEELPPDQKPEGENVAWIPGYWAWDDDESDFLWLSGIWRNLPPGRQWVPGYWSAIGDGRHQWTSGYWADSETTETTYLPTAPPRSLDIGPNIDAPSDDHTWIPGNWLWTDTRYVWRPGHWTPLRENWTWVPSRYCWSRRGYIYVDGYWDYAVASRGILFAPVHFRRHVYVEPSYSYTPSVVVSLDVFSDHLFVRPRCGHYYFGDYYAPRYSSLGFFPSHRWHSRRGCFDPIYAHDRWHHRHDRNWDRRRQDHFNFFRDNEDARPLHNWSAMRNFRGDRFSDDARGRTRQFASSLAGFVRNPAAGHRFQTLDKDRRSEWVARRQEMRSFGQHRSQIESRTVAPADDPRKTGFREKFSRSPVVGRQAERFAKSEAPPKRPEARDTTLRVNPTGRPHPALETIRGDRTSPPHDPEAASVDKPDRRSAVGVHPGRLQPARDREAAITGPANRDAAAKSQARQLPGRTADLVPQRSPQRQAVRDFPARRPEVNLHRPAKPNPQARVTPDAVPPPPVQPHPQVRLSPERKPQATHQPTRQATREPTHSRQAPPMTQSRQLPHRQPRATLQRHAQPKQQVRPAHQREQRAASQRQVHAKPDVRQAPQRMARPAPQRQSHPTPQVRHAAQPKAQSAHRRVQPPSQAHRAKPRSAEQAPQERKRSKKDR